MPRTIQFRFTVGFLLCVVSLIVVVIAAIQVQLRNKLDESATTLISANSENLIAELNRQTTLINTLAQNIAHFVVEAPRDEALFKQVIASMLNLSPSQDLIAGGGYWPEPGKFTEGVDRRSFFWGRNAHGELVYYDDYNNPNGPGYHNEEWYVPTRHQLAGRCYWSRSYIDPYSLQPMVTCSVGVYEAMEFIGVVTVDLKLEGIREFFDDHIREVGGYAFLVDQNNKFISYPDESLSKYDNHMLYADDLARTDRRFASLAESLDRINNEFMTIADRAANNHGDISKQIESQSYQINSNQARIILASLIYPRGNFDNETPLLETVDVDNDVLLNEASTGYVYLVPNTYWKLVLMMPKSLASATTRAVIQNVMGWLLIPAMVILALMFMMIRKLIITPIYSITTQLRKISETEGEHYRFIEHERDDELGQLTFWYNHRTVELKEAMKSLSDANKDLEYQASYDHLTNLPNRRQFEVHLQSVIKNRQWSNKALLYIDIDQFKVINDTTGHPVGDQLLIKIADLLKTTISEFDTVARIGGDEFAALITAQFSDEARQTAQRICNEVEELNFYWDNKHFDTTCSIGVAHLSDINHSLDNALGIVDNACYVAKDNGRNQVYLYQKDDQMVAEREGEMNWLPLIQKALRHNRFFLEFQIIDPTRRHAQGRTSKAQETDPDGAVTLPSIEALVRIRGENDQIIPPGAFLPAAERYNAIVQIDHLVIDLVLQHLYDQPEILQHIDFCSFNLSADTLSDEILLEYIQSCLDKYQVSPQKLCIEVTESKVMSNIVRARDTLTKLQKLGVRVALDDFGAGMSSYGYLNDLPIDLIKIDGRFVRNIRRDAVNQIFVRSIIDIAREMNLVTVAEYVTDELTLNVLKDMGVDYVQGYVISRPLSLNEVQKILSRNGLKSITQLGHNHT